MLTVEVFPLKKKKKKGGTCIIPSTYVILAAREEVPGDFLGDSCDHVRSAEAIQYIVQNSSKVVWGCVWLWICGEGGGVRELSCTTEYKIYITNK